MHLGVDAGNSKTAALVCRADGQVVGAGLSGCGDIYGVARTSEATSAVFESIRQAMAASGVRPGMIATAAFRLAGVDWPEDLAFWERALALELPGLAQVSILNDGFAPIRCGELSGIAVAVVVGTGQAIAGRGRAGAEWALSWWAEERLGASGLGQEALRAACRHDLGLGPSAALARALLMVYQEDSVEAVLHSFTRREGGRPWQEHGHAARQVLAVAQAGDQVACDIIDRHARHLAEYTRVAATKVGFDPASDTVPIVLAGSVVTADQSPLTAALRRELVREMPMCHPVVPALPPVAGAALDAIAAATALNGEVFATLKHSLPYEFLGTAAGQAETVGV